MKMEDLKNIFKVVSVLLLGMAWFFFEFHLSDTDANKKKQLIETELSKECDFRIETCEEYRGFNFMGKNKFNETNFCKFSSSWDLDQKYHIGFVRILILLRLICISKEMKSPLVER